MSRIVTLHSAQGGTGKSNIAANLAVQLALRGKRVGVVDIDLQTPALHIPMALEGLMDKTLNDFLLGNCAIEEAAYDVGARVSQGRLPRDVLYLVPSGVRSREITKGVRGRYGIAPLNDGLMRLAEKLALDYVVADAHTGLGEEGLLAMAVCDLLILTLTTDRKDFQGTAVLLEVARRLEVAPILLVVNMVLPTYNREHLRQQLEQVYGCPVAAMLPFSEEMMLLGSNGILSLRNPEDPFSRGIVEIADQIVKGRL